MALEIKIPSLGESISEVVVSQWYKKTGDYVEKDEPLLELETDKVNQELPSPESGILTVSAEEGDTLSVGDVAGTIEPGERKSAPNKDPDTGKATSEPEPSAAKPKAADSKPEAAEARQESDTKVSSVARKMAEEYGLNLEDIPGSGPGGRVTRDDVEAALANKNKPAAPAAKSATKDTAASGAPAGPRGETRERMSQLRKKIAVRLVEAQHNAAMLTTFNEVDMTTVMGARAKYKEAFQKKHGVGLGFMSFFVKAAVEALKEYPRVNAFIDGEEVIYHHYHDIGVAVGTDRGLVVPVLRNCETMSFAAVEKQIRVYAEKAKQGKLGLDDLTGGTFTISNGGVYGSMMSTPILNPPQSGILGMHNIIRRPIAVGDEIQIRPMMYLALSYDHRIIDGKEAVGFLVRIKDLLEAPERMLLEI